MGKIDKIIKNFKNTKKGQSFEDCEKVLKALGYEVKTGKGSHFKFIKTGQPMLIMARHNPVSPDAVDDVLEIWENENER